MSDDGAGMTDGALHREDSDRYERDAVACDKHLADLRRVHGDPPPMIQPPVRWRIGPRPCPAQFPPRSILATVALRKP